MAHAIVSQAGAGYNYGYTEGAAITIPNGDYAGNAITDASGRIDGQGGEAALMQLMVISCRSIRNNRDK